MGALHDLQTGARLPLLAMHRVGRVPSCAMVLHGPWISREHATIAWAGDAWEVRDLGSHNGTWIDGARVAPGTRATLTEGASIGFGEAAPSHRLVDATGPEPLALLDDGTWREGRGGLLDLSAGGGEGAVVLRDGVTGAWLLESEGRGRAVADGERVEIEGQRVVLRLPGHDALTVPRESLIEPRAVFVVSLDEEHVELMIEENGRSVDLGSRTHHYLLLCLARLRLADAGRPDLPGTAHGWIDADQLSRQLRLEWRYLNVLVFRARKQAAEAGLACAHRLVERRDPAGQLRFGFSDIEVRR